MGGTRRELLAAGAGSLLGLLARGDDLPGKPRPPMGVVIHSYSIRRSAEKGRGFDDPLTFLDYSRNLGAGGVQTSLGMRDDAYAAKLHDLMAAHKVYLEGSIALPRDEADVKRFAAEVRTAKRCGVKVFRTVLMNGRRYEVFDTIKAFREVFSQAQEALDRAKPIVEKHEVYMAVENHKDLLAETLAAEIARLHSPFIGVCIDIGNNLALLETPEKTVEVLAPLAFTTHIKDMDVEEYPEGFLLAEVPLGAGILNLGKIIGALRAAHPDIHLNLEMMTRDPLKIPCLMPRYWVTLDSIPGRRLAEMIALARARTGKKALPRISELSKEEQLRREDDNVRLCLKYAKEHLF